MSLKALRKSRKPTDNWVSIVDSEKARAVTFKGKIIGEVYYTGTDWGYCSYASENGGEGVDTRQGAVHFLIQDHKEHIAYLKRAVKRFTNELKEWI